MPTFRIPGASSDRTRPGLPGRLTAAIVLALSASAVAPATADVYRCVGADGRVTFTDDRAACPGAGRHALQPRLQRVVEGSSDTQSTPAAPDRRTTASETAEAGAEQELWRRKKLQAEATLEAVQKREARLGRTVTGCNRGTEFVTREPETGIKTHVSCDKIRKEYVDTRAKSRQLREYLDDGLEEECRRAGCLPGWVR